MQSHREKRGPADCDCYWPRERTISDRELRIENPESRIENGESTIHVWADEIEFKFKFSDRGGSLQNTEHRVMESSRWSLGLDHDSYRLAFS